MVDVGCDDYGPAPARRVRRGTTAHGLPVLLVGVRCSLEVIWERRRATRGQAVRSADGELIAVERWQRTFMGVAYDLEVDTSRSSPELCAQSIADQLGGPPGTALWAWAEG